VRVCQARDLRVDVARADVDVRELEVYDQVEDP
jgi:hypothetical protein